MTLSRRLAAKALGTAFLLTVVVGSGIMGGRLATGNVAIALLANSVATGCGLWLLITLFGAMSGYGQRGWAVSSRPISLAPMVHGVDIDRQSCGHAGAGRHGIRWPAFVRPTFPVSYLPSW